MCMLAFPCILSHRSNTTYIAYVHWTWYKAPILGVHYPKLQPWFTMTLPGGSDASGWRKWTRDLTLACSGCAIAPSPHLIVRSSTSQLLDNNFTSTLRTCCYWCLLISLTFWNILWHIYISVWHVLVKQSPRVLLKSSTLKIRTWVEKL